MNVCSVKKIQRWNPPIGKVMFFIFSPIILLFLPIVGFIAWIEEAIRDPSRSGMSTTTTRLLRMRWLSYPVAFVMGMLLMPVYLALGPFIASIAFSVNCIRQCCNDCVFVYVFGPIFGLIETPVLVGLSISAVAIFVVVGWVFMLIKVYVFIRKCIDPKYLVPKGGYGYA